MAFQRVDGTERSAHSVAFERGRLVKYTVTHDVHRDKAARSRESIPRGT